MQLVAQGATAGVGGCQTLGQVSEQMDSLLDGQSGQRILPDESCLQARGQSRVQSQERVTWRHSSGEKLLHCTSTKAYSPHMKLCPCREGIYTLCAQ